MPLVVILRGIDPAILKPLALALTQGGLKTIEVTMNTPGAADQIRSLIQWHASDGVQIGAGTV
ncbi:MAG: 2-dehydro-3-deoxyphosphogluconate aldolase, partial [Limisphaerales bacterium]